MKKTQLLFLGLVVALVLVAGSITAALAMDTMPGPIDPQSWTMPRDTNWSDYKPNPVIDWMTEQNPASVYNPSRHAGGNANLGIPAHRNTPINGAIILVDFYDRPFLMLGEKNTDLFGWHTFDENDSYTDYLAKIDNGDPVTKNPQRVVDGEAALRKFWEDFLNKKITDPKDNAFNHGANTDEFWREVSYGKWNVDLTAFGPYHLDGLELEYGFSYVGSNDHPPTLRRSGSRNLISDSIAAANAHNVWLGDYDFFFVCHSGYDQSGVWMEFGQVQWANGADVPYEYGPKAKMDELELLFTAHPEYILTMDGRGGYSQPTIRSEADKIRAHQASGTLDQYEFKFPAADWTWADNYIGQSNSLPGTPGGHNTSPTRYVKWTSWAAGMTKWASSSGYSGTSVRSSWGTNVTNIPYSQQAECNGMATYAHEFGHIVNLPDNYSSPFADSVSARTEPWDLMARGCFAGPFGDHARWSVPGGLEADSAPVHMMFPSKRYSGFYDQGDIYSLSVATLKTTGPVVKEVVARNIPMNNGGHYPKLEEYGLIAPNFYKAIELTFDSANTERATLVTSGWSNTRSRAVAMSIEVVERTGYDSYAPDDGVIISRLNSLTNGSGYQVVDSHLDNKIQTMTDYYLNGAPVGYPIAHQVHLMDGAFKAGVSFTDSGYYVGGEYKGDTRGIAGKVPEKNEIISGNTVNEYHDTANKLHYYILDRHDNPGKVSTFLSYSIGILHEDGVAVNGDLNVKASVEPEIPGKVAVASFDITNTGTATDIIRVKAEGDQSPVLLNNIYAVGAGETVTVPVYVEIPYGIRSQNIKGQQITLTASSESNNAKVGTASVLIEDLLAYNYNVYLVPDKANYFVGETMLVDVMLKGDANYTIFAADVAFDTEFLTYETYDFLTGWVASITAGKDKVSIRSMPSSNMVLGSPTDPAVKIATLKFTVNTSAPQGSNATALCLPSIMVTPAGTMKDFGTAPDQPVIVNVHKIGNEAMQQNLLNFPDFYNFATGRTNSNISTTGVITEEVWIEAPLDTDFDGKRDRMRVLIRRPAATRVANGGLKCPAVLFLTPYSNNTSGGTGTAFATFGGRVYSGFPDQGPAPTRLHSTAFAKRPDGVTGVLTNYDHWKTIYGPEGDLSYKALRDLTDTRIGKGAQATVARYRDLLADGMLDATQEFYTAHPEIVANYPWLPPATTPTSVQTDGNTTSTAPASAGAFGSAATNNARGYAQVTAHMLGNSNAEGFLRYGQYEESIAAAAVVDWLNGRIRAYTTRTSTVEVKAYWASGDCAASGTSYEGTLPVAAAVTGVEGLRTIYPGAPVTNAYNYFRENAIAYGPGGYVGEDIMATSHYTQGRLWSSSAQAYPGNNSPAWDVWWDWQLYQRFEGDGGVGDYSSFWDERNPLSFADDMRKDVGVIMGAGLNDGNVKFRNTGLLNEALKHNGVEVIKGQWSQGQHEMANGMSGGWTNATNMHLWLDYYLWGIDNGIVDSVPNYRIASNISGVKDYDVWPAGVYQKFYPQGGRVGTIATTPQANITTHTFKDDFLASSLVTFPTFDYAAISTSSQVPTQARANGVGLANGFLPNALIQQGQAQSLAANSRSAWRNRIVGGLNNSTTAWGAPSNRFCLASSALAGTFSKTAEVIDRVIYRMDIPENFTISGPPSMTAEIAASKDVGALSCMLVEWWSGGVKVVALGSVDVRNPNPDGTLSFDVPGIANIEKGGNWHPNYLFQTQDILPYGTSTPTAANFNSYTWEMDVTEYTFRAGRELCVILFGSDPEFTFMTKAPTEFTVNIGPNTYLSLPIVNPITVSTISEEVVEEIDFETEEAEVIEMTEMLEVVETVAEVAETIIIIE